MKLAKAAMYRGGLGLQHEEAVKSVAKHETAKPFVGEPKRTDLTCPTARLGTGGWAMSLEPP